jgi:hypothetical protein
MERRDVHARRFALFGLLAGLHAQNPCEPRVQAMYAASGHPPVMCGDAEKEQMEIIKTMEAALQMKDITIKQLMESIENKNAHIECLETCVRLLHERLQRELSSGASRPQQK